MIDEKDIVLEDAESTENQEATTETTDADIDVDIMESDSIDKSTDGETDGLAKKIEEALNSANDKYLRLLAEYDNYRKRTVKEKAEIYSDATVSCILEMLPVIDNFERALETECSDDNYRVGIEMIFNQLKSILEKMNVKEIEAFNKPFDPNLHNAIKRVDDDKFEENTICEVYQKGYMLKDKVIRYAMVVVAN
ncbi:MAG: nucleotide exchange factor GrpE [Clostridiales bacterium]|nr:nucleotide exchange factor GrpE [Clostridiales bacterium]